MPLKEHLNLKFQMSKFTRGWKDSEQFMNPGWNYSELDSETTISLLGENFLTSSGFLASHYKEHQASIKIVW